MINAWCNGKLPNGMDQITGKTHSQKEISKNMFRCCQGLDEEHHLTEVFQAVLDGKVLFKRDPLYKGKKITYEEMANNIKEDAKTCKKIASFFEREFGEKQLDVSALENDFKVGFKERINLTQILKTKNAKDREVRFAHRCKYLYYRARNEQGPRCPNPWFVLPYNPNCIVDLSLMSAVERKMSLVFIDFARPLSSVVCSLETVKTIIENGLTLSKFQQLVFVFAVYPGQDVTTCLAAKDTFSNSHEVAVIWGSFEFLKDTTKYQWYSKPDAILLFFLFSEIDEEEPSGKVMWEDVVRKLEDLKKDPLNLNFRFIKGEDLDLEYPKGDIPTRETVEEKKTRLAEIFAAHNIQCAPKFSYTNLSGALGQVGPSEP